VYEYTVTKAKLDAGAQHTGDGKSVIQIDRSEKSGIKIDWAAAQPTWMTEFSSAQMLCSCVTLGFLTADIKGTA
jgi:hypothetical protein